MADGNDRKVAIIGAALDLGAGATRGRHGALRDPLRGHPDDRLRELGIGCADWGTSETAVAEATASGSPQARFLDQIKETCERIAGAVAATVEDGRTPVLGGDHSIALGTLGGLASVHGPGAVLWFDAHGDLNTPETSPSGNVHGMPLGAALGRDPDAFASGAWPLPALGPERVVLIGVRSLDEGERVTCASGIGVYTMSELDRRGIEPVVREALERVEGRRSCTSRSTWTWSTPMAPGVGTPVRGGLSYREAHLALELVAESGLLSSSRSSRSTRSSTAATRRPRSRSSWPPAPSALASSRSARKSSIAATVSA